MDNVKDIIEMEKKLEQVKNKINLFFELMENGVESAKQNKEEVPLMFIDRENKDITLYDIEKDIFYDVPMKNLLSIKTEESNEGYVLDITNLLKKYVETTIRLVDKIDQKKGEI